MADQKTEQSKTKGLKHRSPAYPFISLRRALERARKFYSEQRQHAAPLSAAVALWEFGAKSSGGLQTISALKQFGLLAENEVNNTRQVKLTDSALRVIQDERDVSPEREAAIKRLALLPKVYSEMWNKWGAQLPADATVKFFLVNEKKYNEAAFPDLFSAYKDTIEFAKLGESDKNGSDDGVQDTPQGQIINPPPAPPPKGANLMEGERIVFTHEIEPAHGVRVLANGIVDDSMLDALELYIELQRRRLSNPPRQESAAPPSPTSLQASSNKAGISWFITKAQKAQLRERGYSDEDIGKMKAEDAHKLLGVAK